MEKERCDWATGSERLLTYHDKQWGVPEHDERQLFKMLTLEIFQAGLAWDTVLRFEAGITAAFHDFQLEEISQFSTTEREMLYLDKRLIRNHAKIDATIENAKVLVQLHQSGESLDHLVWSTFSEAPIDLHGTMTDPKEIKQFTKAICQQMKGLGFMRVGPTTCYSFLQSIGVVNDHNLSCFRYAELVDKKKLSP